MKAKTRFIPCRAKTEHRLPNKYRGKQVPHRVTQKLDTIYQTITEKKETYCFLLDLNIVTEGTPGCYAYVVQSRAPLELLTYKAQDFLTVQQFGLLEGALRLKRCPCHVFVHLSHAPVCGVWHVRTHTRLETMPCAGELCQLPQLPLKPSNFSGQIP